MTLKPRKTFGYLFEFQDAPNKPHTLYRVLDEFYSLALVNKAVRVVDLKNGVFVKDQIKDSRVTRLIEQNDYAFFTHADLKKLGLSRTFPNYRVTDIYFDMDGTLFDYDSQIFNFCGKRLETLTKEEKHAVTSIPGFFETMPLYEGVDAMYELAKRHNKSQVHILSAVGTKDPARITKEKSQALHDKLSHWDFCSVNFVKHSSYKSYYAQPYRLLVDDREKAYEPFELNGGHIIKHTSVQNTCEQLTEFW